MDRTGNDGNDGAYAEFDFESHDDIFRISGFMKEKGLFKDGREAVQFALGLKLFSGVMIRHRDEELFRDFEPAFREFMKRLKSRD